MMTKTNLYASRKAIKALEDSANDDQWARFVDERLEIEDAILELPVTSMADVAVKLEIVIARAKLFDGVDYYFERLLDQVAAFESSDLHQHRSGTT
jgi:hypothetical protein